MTTNPYVDANLNHGQVTGRAVTACLHLVKATPTHGHTKRQGTVETATLDLNLWQPGLLQTRSLISGTPSCLLESQSNQKLNVDSASILTSILSNKSTLASYHQAKEALTAGYLQLSWKDGKSNPEDNWIKHWEFASIWPLLKPLLFWKGDTCEHTAKMKRSDRISS